MDVCEGGSSAPFSTRPDLEKLARRGEADPVRRAMKGTMETSSGSRGFQYFEKRPKNDLGSLHDWRRPEAGYPVFRNSLLNKAEN
jgi:hypothetical protein